jgi:succinate dehydrogenase / fumarate reductase iron-sulfur subunit
MSNDDVANVEIFRFDPETDSEPRYDKFEAPYKGFTVLNVLTYIYENLDSTFTFRWACSKGFCRACVVTVNGKPCFSCMMPASRNMRIEPHPKFQIVKDLIVDFDTLR